MLFQGPRGREAGKPSMVKRTIIKTHTNYSNYGRGAPNLDEVLRQVFTRKFIELLNA